FCLPPSAFCFPLSAFCLLPSALCLLPSAFCLRLLSASGLIRRRSIDRWYFRARQSQINRELAAMMYLIVKLGHERIDRSNLVTIEINDPVQLLFARLNYHLLNFIVNLFKRTNHLLHTIWHVLKMISQTEITSH